MTMLYPLKFNPVYSYRIWAGDKLKTLLNKKYNEDLIGESWEISDIKDNETRVANGILKNKTLKELITEHKTDIVGEKNYKLFGNEFPLLIKFIDAKTPLSIQVHPDDDLAKQRHNSFGKNEMWYIMQADKDAELIVGFNKDTNKKDYSSHVKNNTITNILNHEKVTKGDTFYIPAGRVHAIGAGVLLAEIQQKSDVTYRIFDYNRIDKKTGKTRELHTELALDAIDYNADKNYKTNYTTKTNSSNPLVHSPYFKTNIVEIQGKLKMDYSKTDSFVIYMCVEGALTLTHNAITYQLNIGETILLPAAINQVQLQAENESRILEVTL